MGRASVCVGGGEEGVVERGFVCVWEGEGCGLSWWWCWCCSFGIIFRGSSVDLDRLESFA